MNREDYRLYAADSVQFGTVGEPADAHIQVLGMDKSFLPGCMVTGAGWYKSDYHDQKMIKHNSDQVLMFLGGDHDHPNDLNATVTLQIENDTLTLDQCCAVFIPAGVAYGNLRVSNVKMPVAYYFVQTQTDTYEETPAEPTAPAGTYANHFVERFEPSNGYVPGAPAGLLTPLVWIDGGRIENSPYGEAVWFNRSSDEGPEAHTHTYGEFLSFLGTDPEHPEDLGCTVEFYIDGEPVDIEQSSLLYIPAGVSHSPFYIHNMTRSILHTSGYAGSDYERG